MFSKAILLILLLGILCSAQVIDITAAPKAPLRNCLVEDNGVCTLCEPTFRIAQNKTCQRIPLNQQLCTAQTCNSITPAFSPNQEPSKDRMKTDGRYIYMSRNNDVYILEVYPGQNLQQLSVIKGELQIENIYFSDSYLAIIETYEQSQTRVGIIPYININIYDISNKSSPLFLYQYVVNGNALETDLIGNFLYVVGSGIFYHPKKPYYTTRQGEYFYVDDNRSIRDQPAFRGGPFGAANGNFISIFRLNIFDPHPDKVKVTEIQFDDYNIQWLQLTDNGIFITFIDTFKSDPVTILSKIAIEQDIIQIVEQKQFFDGITGLSSVKFNKNIFCFITHNYIRQTSIISCLDNNLGRLYDDQFKGISTSIEFIGRKIYVRMSDPETSLKLYEIQQNMSFRYVGQGSFYGYSSFMDFFQQDRVIAYRVLQTSQKRLGIEIVLFNITDINNPIRADYLRYTQQNGQIRSFSRNGLLISRNKNLLIVPYRQVTASQETIETIGYYDLYIDRNQLIFRSQNTISQELHNSLIIEEFVYFQNQCNIEANKIFINQQRLKVPLQCA